MNSQKRDELLNIVDKLSRENFENKESELISTYLSLEDFDNVYEVYKNSKNTDPLENHYCLAL